MKALEILKKILKEINDDNLFLSEDFISNIDIRLSVMQLEELENRSCSNCDDFDNEMDCDEFGFCTNEENNKDFKGRDLVRTRSNFCCNNWKNKA